MIRNNTNRYKTHRSHDKNTLGLLENADIRLPLWSMGIVHVKKKTRVRDTSENESKKVTYRQD